MRILFALLLVLLPALALSQPSAAPPAPAVPTAAPVVASAPLAVVSLPDGGVDVALPPSAAPAPSVAPSVAPASDAVSSLPDPGPVQAAKDLADAVVAAKQGPTLTAIAGAIMACVILLVSLARRFGGLLVSSGKLRAFIVFATALVGGLACVQPGMTWWQAALLTAAPVLSVGVHQTFIRPLGKG